MSSVNSFDLRLYVIVQASLFLSLVLSLALSTLSSRLRHTFLLLGLGSFLHLALDMLQVKWANGVHFLAPFSWDLINVGLFWPESVVTYTLTGLGLLYVLIHVKEALAVPADLIRPRGNRLLLLVVVLGLYFLLPLLLMSGPEQADNHYVKTLRNRQDRVGKGIEVDRGFYNASEDRYHTFFGEGFELEGVKLDQSAMLSIRGKFLDKDRIRVENHHIHSSDFRDIASVIGLFAILMIWAVTVTRQMVKGLNTPI